MLRQKHERIRELGSSVPGEGPIRGRSLACPDGQSGVPAA